MKKEDFLRLYLSEIEDGNAALFAGAGLSIDAGYVDWKNLLTPLAKELGLNLDLEQDLVSVAQFFRNSNNRNRITQKLIDELGTVANPTVNHEILASLPISTIWTTNYDRLIEDALKAEGKIVDSKYNKDQLANTRRGRDVVLYKMHGDIENPQETTLTKDEYEKYPFTHAPFITALSGDLVERNDFDTDAQFENGKIKQELVAQDLNRFHINVVFVEKYSDITSLLKKLYKQYKRKTVFFSGSADDFGPWQKHDVEEALFKLGSSMVDKGFRVASGVGLGIGNPLISGAISSAYKKQQSHLDDHLLMRPFPQFIKDDKERANVWTRYREAIIGKSGIALFFMGNKRNGKETVAANGVIEEFEIALSKGVFVIPIGCSGFVAKTLWERVTADIATYYPDASANFIDKLNELGQEVDGPAEIISQVTELMELVIKE